MTTPILQAERAPEHRISADGNADLAESRPNPTYGPSEPFSASEANLRITVPRKTNGYWTANVSLNGVTRTFHNRHLGWQTDRKRSDDWPPRAIRKEAAPHIARALQAKIKRLERRERRISA